MPSSLSFGILSAPFAFQPGGFLLLHLHEGLIDGISGPFAGVTFYKSKETGAAEVRRRPLHAKRPDPSAAQKANQAKFRDAVYAWVRLPPATKMLWRKAVNRPYTSGADCFIRTYLQALAKGVPTQTEPEPGDGCWPPCPKPPPPPPKPPKHKFPVAGKCLACTLNAPNRRSPRFVLGAIRWHALKPVWIHDCDACHVLQVRDPSCAYGRVFQHPNEYIVDSSWSVYFDLFPWLLQANVTFKYRGEFIYFDTIVNVAYQVTLPPDPLNCAPMDFELDVTHIDISPFNPLDWACFAGSTFDITTT